MSDQVVGILIASLVSPLVLLLLTRVLGRRRESVETEGAVAAQWQAWSAELKERVVALEDDVAELKKSLDAERDKNERQSRLMRSLVRWAILLRDEVIRLGGNVPPAPVEVEAAMTNLEA